MDPKEFWMKAVDITELRRLETMLTAAGIQHEWLDEPEMGGATIKVPTQKAWRASRGISIIQNRGSYGGPGGKLECWCKTKKRNEREPEGWLSAEEVLARVKEAVL